MRCHCDDQDINAMMYESQEECILPKIDYRKDFLFWIFSHHIDKLLANPLEVCKSVPLPSDENLILHKFECIYRELEPYQPNPKRIFLDPTCAENYLKSLNQTKEVVSIILKSQKKLSSYGINVCMITSIINIFMDTHNYEVVFDLPINQDNLKKIRPIIHEYFLNFIKRLSIILNYKEFEKYKIKLLNTGFNDKDAPKEKKNPLLTFKNLVIRESEYPGSHLVLFKDCILLAKDTQFLNDLLTKSYVLIVNSVMFHNCTFMNDLEFVENAKFRTPVVFRKCVFEKNIRFPKFINHMVYFRDCLFRGWVFLNEKIFNSAIRFVRCFFDKGSQLTFTSTKHEYVLEETRKILLNYVSIDDCLFLGKLEIINADFTDVSFSIKNTGLLSDFNFSGTKFGKNTTIESTAFPYISSLPFATRIGNLYKALDDSGLKDQTNFINLSSKKDVKAFDLESYKAELESDTIKSLAAAKYIGKSSDWLAHKRMSDRQKERYDSLPFIGKGKNITYPVEALDAYKNHDWKKLKELRQKYPIPKDSD